MKTKIVLWGSNDKDDKILLGIELLELENKVKIYTFPDNVATEEFYNRMMNLWRDGQPVPFPEGHEVIEHPLSMTDSLLPDNLRTTRTDVLNRAKTEWHFVVLSAKLYKTYVDEIHDFKDRIKSLTRFEGSIWEEMKSFWEKVQGQVREKNLFRNHASDLRDKTNEIFDSLKGLKKVMNEEFEEVSTEHLGSFMEKLKNIEERIEKGMGLQPIFNELKNLQRTFRDTNFTRKHRSEVWKRLDGAFKIVKEKKYGKQQSGGSALSRISRRYEGLLSAIQKMEISISRDKKERDFQLKRIDSTDGQLEMQIRQAKLAMIEERIQSKESKLAEMQKTKVELEKKMELEKKKEEKRIKQAEVNKLKESIKQEVAEDIEKASQARKEDEVTLQQAADDIKESNQSENKESASVQDVSENSDTESDSNSKNEEE